MTIRSPKTGKVLGPSKGEVVCIRCGARENFADLYALCETCWNEVSGRDRNARVPTATRSRALKPGDMPEPEKRAGRERNKAAGFERWIPSSKNGRGEK